MRILIVDDDEDVRMLVRMSLERVGGFEVLSAASGREGVAHAREQQPDAILLDMMMPGMDGRATVAELRGLPETADIPIVLITAKISPRDHERFGDLPIQGAISKPFDPIELPGQIAKLVDAGG
jgi:CheY-like chemotaxis protein